MKFHIRPSRSTLLAVLLLVSGTLSLLGPGAASTLRSKFHWIHWPVGEPLVYLTSMVKRAIAPEPVVSKKQVETLRHEKKRLNQEVKAIQYDLARLRKRRGGAELFSAIFGASSDVPVCLVPARVVATDSLPYGWNRLLTEGKNQGAREGMWVTNRILLTDRSKKMTPNHLVLAGVSLVGQIQEAGAFTARMKLINDRGFRIRANILRRIDPREPRQIRHDGRMQALTSQNNFPIPVEAHGDGAGGLIIPEVKAVHNIRPGDVLQTLADSMVLPAVVEIGTVRNVRQDSLHSGMVTLEVTPSADLPSLRDVYIVVPITTPPVRPKGGR